MKGKSVASSRSNGGEEEVSARNLRREVLLGDVIWVKLDDSSWWPGQVSDENTVSGGFKPRKRSVGNVLVRLYGTYEYKYVDPIECSDFAAILEQHNGCPREILQKTLELHRSYLKSGRSRAQSKFIGSTNVNIDSAKDKKTNHKNHKQVDRKLEASDCRSSDLGKASSPRITRTSKGILTCQSVLDMKIKAAKQDKAQKDQRLNSPSSGPRTYGTLPKLSTSRRLRVMQDLGLTAPIGSPFGKNGDIDPIV